MSLKRRDFLLAAGSLSICSPRSFANQEKSLTSQQVSELEKEQADSPFAVTEGTIAFRTTTGYPDRWQKLYQSSVEHFAKRWGRVGPTHVFLIENDDWGQKISAEKKRELAKSHADLKRAYCELQGQDSEGTHLDWHSGNHWSAWSIEPACFTITMTMNPYRDGLQFVLGPLHEYVHCYQMAYGHFPNAVRHNRMGQALWTGPNWWREGSASLIAAHYAYRCPELFKGSEESFGWKQYCHEMNRNLDFFKKAKTKLKNGSTHDQWQELEKEKHVYHVIYAGGTLASAMLLKRVGSLSAFMDFFERVPALGWQAAFEKHFKIAVGEFLVEFEKEMRTTKVQLRSSGPENAFHFLRDIK